MFYTMNPIPSPRLAARKSIAAMALLTGIVTLAPSEANAHVSIVGPVHAGGREIVTFSVGHGCEGSDTIGIVVTLPPEVTTVRGIPSPEFGEADVIADDAGVPLAVAWDKDTVRSIDDAYYQLAIRITVPETPFATLYFPVTQTCRDSEGVETVVEWNALPGDAVVEGEEVPPAAALSILPPHSPGWNRYVAAADIIDLSAFDDAEIVWVGDAAYSSNAVTTELIAAEPDVTPLVGIQSGAEIWVKY